MEKIYIYGAGIRGKRIAEILHLTSMPLAGFLDTYKDGTIELEDGSIYKIYPLDSMDQTNSTVIVAIANRNANKEISEMIESRGIKVLSLEQLYNYKKKRITSLDEVMRLYHISDDQENNIGINPADISVLIQGAIDNDITKVLIESIRLFLPGSTIVVSTWKGENISDLESDIVILNDDPGGYWNERLYTYDVEFLNNTNRQLVSTAEGLKCISTKYTLKVRSDMVLTSLKFLKMFDVFSEHNETLRIFSHKVLIADTNTKHHWGKRYYFVYHPSDWFFFGYTEDIKTYFMNTPVAKKEELCRYTQLRFPERKSITQYAYNFRFNPEQYYAVSALNGQGYETFACDWTDWNEKSIKQSEWFIMNNFIPLDFDHHGILLPKYDDIIFANNGKRNYVTHGIYGFERYKRFYDFLFHGQGNYEDIWFNE